VLPTASCLCRAFTQPTRVPAAVPTCTCLPSYALRCARVGGSLCPQVQAAIAACRHQQEHLAHIAAHLPPFLPSAPQAAPAQQQQQQQQQLPQQQPLQQRQGSAAEAAASRASAAKGGGGRSEGVAGAAHGAGRGAAAGAAKENAGTGRSLPAGGAAGGRAAPEPAERRQRPPAPRRCAPHHLLGTSMCTVQHPTRGLGPRLLSEAPEAPRKLAATVVAVTARRGRQAEVLHTDSDPARCLHVQVCDAGRAVVAVIVHARTPDAGQGAQSPCRLSVVALNTPAALSLPEQPRPCDLCACVQHLNG